MEGIGGVLEQQGFVSFYHCRFEVHVDAHLLVVERVSFHGRRATLQGQDFAEGQVLPAVDFQGKQHLVQFFFGQRIGYVPAAGDQAILWKKTKIVFVENP